MPRFRCIFIRSLRCACACIVSVGGAGELPGRLGGHWRLAAVPPGRPGASWCPWGSIADSIPRSFFCVVLFLIFVFFFFSYFSSPVPSSCLSSFSSVSLYLSSIFLPVVLVLVRHVF